MTSSILAGSRAETTLTTPFPTSTSTTNPNTSTPSTDNTLAIVGATIATLTACIVIIYCISLVLRRLPRNQPPADNDGTRHEETGHEETGHEETNPDEPDNGGIELTAFGE
ncbi:hypothetical protein O9K51_02669 [Purpureocillium lavendulum]|uniref:Uncharacterized protein n=1 Tax=Purpureocillium lavendulum TaxID=1247861 RepID=A0AB34FYT0_9HYPO|nr:hypothetical protein O9K51_02669 [Purpureocillium lavendulum]